MRSSLDMGGYGEAALYAELDDHDEAYEDVDLLTDQLHLTILSVKLDDGLTTLKLVDIIHCRLRRIKSLQWNTRNTITRYNGEYYHRVQTSQDGQLWYVNMLCWIPPL